MDIAHANDTSAPVVAGYHGSTTPPNERDYWQTPWWFVRQLEAETGLRFIIDVAATKESAKAPIFWDKSVGPDGSLGIDWKLCADADLRMGPIPPAMNNALFMNPPFSQIDDWLKKAVASARSGLIVVGITPDLPDPAWYQRWVENEATTILKPDGRINYMKADGTKPKNGPPFPSCAVIWTPWKPKTYNVHRILRAEKRYS